MDQNEIDAQQYHDEIQRIRQEAEQGRAFRALVVEVLGECIHYLPGGETWAATNEGVVQYLRDIIDGLRSSLGDARQLQEFRDWICRKLDAPIEESDSSIFGRMHVICANSDAHRNYCCTGRTEWHRRIGELEIAAEEANKWQELAKLHEANAGEPERCALLRQRIGLPPATPPAKVDQYWQGDQWRDDPNVGHFAE